jgi:hypothetical protein
MYKSLDEFLDPNQDQPSDTLKKTKLNAEALFNGTRIAVPY